MFSKPQEARFEFPKEALWPVHTWFVRFPIDLYYYNAAGKLVEKKLGMEPWNIYNPCRKAKTLIEKPSEKANS